LKGYFSIFKRGMKGTYQHCGKKHLHRFSRSLTSATTTASNRIAFGVNDTERTRKLAQGIVGKRLTYRRTKREAAHA
jgi:hypothetical protein